MSRPIGNYQHQRTGRLHQGHLMRLRNYIKGGIPRMDTARLCGVSHRYVLTLAKQWGLDKPGPGGRGP